MNYIKQYYEKRKTGEIKTSRKVKIVYEKLVKDIDNPKIVKVYNEYSEEESLQKLRESSLSTVWEIVKNDTW